VAETEATSKEAEVATKEEIEEVEVTTKEET